MDGYKTLKSAAEFELTEKKSRFIASAAPAATEQTAKAFTDEIKSNNKAARHNVFAYIVENGAITRFSDDGEPQGTGGTPALAALKSAGVVNAAVVVTRYFGGILLGAAGLARAYGAAAREAVKAAGIITVAPFVRCELSVDYALDGKARRELDAAGIEIISVSYAETAVFETLVPPEKQAAVARLIADISSGKASVTFGEI